MLTIQLFHFPIPSKNEEICLNNHTLFGTLSIYTIENWETFKPMMHLFLRIFFNSSMKSKATLIIVHNMVNWFEMILFDSNIRLLNSFVGTIFNNYFCFRWLQIRWQTWICVNFWIQQKFEKFIHVSFRISSTRSQGI